MTPTRPLLRWHGGKWRIAPRIIALFPRHRIYVEPFGGAASVLIRKPRAYAEVWNDLDGDVVNLMRVLRSPQAGELIQALRLTPFAHEEFREAYQPCEEPVERARRLVIRRFMGFGSNGHARSTGFRDNSTRLGSTPAHDWVGYPDALAVIVERLQGVAVQNLDARKVMARHDGPATLHYVDPPYIMSTRGDPTKDYAHEMEDHDHRELIEFLRGLAGHVVLSGYTHPIYEEGLADWHRVEMEAMADGARPRLEVLWINPRCRDALERETAERTPQGMLAL